MKNKGEVLFLSLNNTIVMKKLLISHQIKETLKSPKFKISRLRQSFEINIFIIFDIVPPPSFPLCFASHKGNLGLERGGWMWGQILKPPTNGNPMRNSPS